MADQSPTWTETRESGTLWQLRIMRFLATKSLAFVTVPLLWVIAVIFVLDPRRASSRASIAFLNRVLGRVPTLRERIRHARVFSHVYFDRVRLLVNGVGQFSTRAQNPELVRDLVAQGKGAVLLGAHYGSFEALRALDRELPGLSVRYLMFLDNAAKSTSMLQGLNPEVTNRTISLADGPMAMIDVADALKGGEFVAVLGDRIPDTSVRAKAVVRFLGGHIEIPTSPYLIAMAAKVPIILSFARWEGKDRYAAEFLWFYDGAHVPRSERNERAAEMAQNYATTLERLCRDDPYNWFNFFDIWRR